MFINKFMKELDTYSLTLVRTGFILTPGVELAGVDALGGAERIQLEMIKILLYNLSEVVSYVDRLIQSFRRFVLPESTSLH